MKVFISYANEDKDAIARPLAVALRYRGIDVWFDEFSLSPGDSLRESIEKGLAESDYGIVILSAPFFDKPWPTKELNGIFSRYLAFPNRRILFPLRHEITTDYIREKAPMLSDILALDSSKGVEAIVKVFLSTVIKDDQTLRHSGKISVDFEPVHRYFNPPKDLPRHGYKLRLGNYDELVAQLRPREMLFVYGHPLGANYQCAGHVTSEERMLEFERDFGAAPDYYAAEYHKVAAGLNLPLSKDEIRKVSGTQPLPPQDEEEPGT